MPNGGIGPWVNQSVPISIGIPYDTDFQKKAETWLKIHQKKSFLYFYPNLIYLVKNRAYMRHK